MPPLTEFPPTEEEEHVADENIVYPSMALTIVVFSLFICVLIVLFSIRNEIQQWSHNDSVMKTTTRKKFLLMRRRISLKNVRLCSWLIIAYYWSSAYNKICPRVSYIKIRRGQVFIWVTPQNWRKIWLTLTSKIPRSLWSHAFFRLPSSSIFRKRKNWTGMVGKSGRLFRPLGHNRKSGRGSGRGVQYHKTLYNCSSVSK